MSDELRTPDRSLREAAERALAAIGRAGDNLQPVWFTRERATFLLAEPAPALFVKVYQQAEQLEHEVAVLRRAAAAGIPVAPLMAFRGGPPAVLITEQVAGVPLSSAYPLAAEATGRLLRRFHALGAAPPYAGGQRRWSEFIIDWAEREIDTALARGALTDDEARRLRRHFSGLASVLDRRPCALLQGDFQTAHVLIDPATQHVSALLDFVDTQPGDPLVDIAILTLWDQALTPAVLRGYGSDDPDAPALLPAYRLLRLLAAANWLVANGAPEYLPAHERAVHQALEIEIEHR
ncbi:MAG TPA: phosphotransferase [Thermomicrobiaceae bacterium]|nr:phosphotransferase [Thermomicrobiaceae bacterium]